MPAAITECRSCGFEQVAYFSDGRDEGSLECGRCLMRTSAVVTELDADMVAASGASVVMA